MAKANGDNGTKSTKSGDQKSSAEQRRELEDRNSDLQDQVEKLETQVGDLECDIAGERASRKEMRNQRSDDITPEVVWARIDQFAKDFDPTGGDKSDKAAIRQACHLHGQLKSILEERAKALKGGS